MNKSIKYLLQFFAIISFLNISAQSGEPFANVKTPKEATASLKLLSEKYKVGVTPLLCTVLANSYEGTKILLDASANPNVTKPSNNPKNNTK